MIGAPSQRRRRKNSTRPGASERRVVPFDYAFRFSLIGSPGVTAISAVEVSVEGIFTAVSIGYGIVPEVHPITFGIAPTPLLDQLNALDRAGGNATAVPFDTVPLRFMIGAIAEQFEELPPATVPVPKIDDDSSVLKILSESMGKAGGAGLLRAPGPRTAAALRNGLRFNPEFAELLLQADRRTVPLEALSRCFQLVAPPPKDVQFKYALFDDASGREFQSEPILNTAGLGAADGRRPFRYFARPMEFGPRSRIRMQITEVSDFRGELHVSLQGFKRLGEAGTPTGRVSR